MEKQNHNVVAVLLTQNRKELLQKGLTGLFNQTCNINRILIIDSVSTDGTYLTSN